ncbi:MAG: HipA N-terminal domain-containing protein [Alphaproteobacteria bacterium]
MGRRPAYATLNVFLNAPHVGALSRARSGAFDFRYEADWLGWENALPVSLSMPLREDRYVAERVSAVFENLLPDNMDLRRRTAERMGASAADAFSLLSATSRVAHRPISLSRCNAPWIRIGAAREHSDGQGMTAQLDLVPAGGGRIVYRVYDPNLVEDDHRRGALKRPCLPPPGFSGPAHRPAFDGPQPGCGPPACFSPGCAVQPKRT